MPLELCTLILSSLPPHCIFPSYLCWIFLLYPISKGLSFPPLEGTMSWRLFHLNPCFLLRLSLSVCLILNIPSMPTTSTPLSSSSVSMVSKPLIKFSAEKAISPPHVKKNSPYFLPPYCLTPSWFSSLYMTPQSNQKLKHKHWSSYLFFFLVF